MNATVNENCIGCPTAFGLFDRLEAAQEARDGCPVSAISIEA